MNATITIKKFFRNIAACVVLSISPILTFSQFTITQSISNVLCSGDTTGSISVNVSGGLLPYTYQWLPDGQTTPSISFLGAGTYSLIVTDNALKDSTFVFQVLEPLPIDDGEQISSPFCTNNGNIVLLPAGGTNPYSFAWSTGHTTQVVAQAVAGAYSVIITDANNCSASFAYTLEEEGCFVKADPYFTPNGDGFNDTWFIANSQFFPDAHLIIFDRWGTKVFEHKGTYEGWDGKSYLGLPVPDAVYYYFFYQDKDDKQKASKRGSVTVVR